MIFFLVIVFLTAVVICGYAILATFCYACGEIASIIDCVKTKGKASSKDTAELWKHIGLLIVYILGLIAIIMMTIKMFS